MQLERGRDTTNASSAAAAHDASAGLQSEYSARDAIATYPYVCLPFFATATLTSRGGCGRRLWPPTLHRFTAYAQPPIDAIKRNQFT